MTVYVLTRTLDGDVVVQGVFSTQKRAEKARENYEVACGYGTEYKEYQFDWEIHREKVDERD